MLTVPRDVLAQRLDERIKLGKDLVKREVPQRAEDVEEFEDDASAWNDYSLDLIRRSFTTYEEVNRYRAATAWYQASGAPQHRHEYLKERLRLGIRSLASLKERLPLFLESPSVEAGVPQTTGHTSPSNTEPAIFLVHGRDDGAKHGVARFVQAVTKIEPIILAEQPNLGQTVIEKFEKHASQVSYAIVLVTGDDEGRLIGEQPLRPRARQNVILELGWFAGRLGRQKVALLYKRGVELPSDMGGVLYAELDPGEGWKLKLAKEMRAAGLPVDMNKV
jgi:predicted nucleotide-binding protein